MAPLETEATGRGMNFLVGVVLAIGVVAELAFVAWLAVRIWELV
jgi:hypothetical protein